MRSRSAFNNDPRTDPRTIHNYIARSCQLLVLFATLSCLAGTTTDRLWALPPAPGEQLDEAPTIIDFTADQYPGEDNWRVSGRIVGCEDPSDIIIAIRGVVNKNARTDVAGYFEVIVTYAGSVDTAVANANYEGSSLPQAYCSIGF